MKTNNPIIQHRLNQLRDQKTALLKLKKADRGNQLESINQTINRLKKWIQESGTMIECSNPVEDILKQQRIVNDMERDIRFQRIEPTHLFIEDMMNPEFKSGLSMDGFADWLTSIQRPTRNDESNDDIIVANAKETPQTNGKPSPITGKWLEETPEAYEARKTDVATAFRRMNGFG